MENRSHPCTEERSPSTHGSKKILENICVLLILQLHQPGPASRLLIVLASVVCCCVLLEALSLSLTHIHTNTLSLVSKENKSKKIHDTTGNAKSTGMVFPVPKRCVLCTQRVPCMSNNSTSHINSTRRCIQLHSTGASSCIAQVYPAA